MREKKLSMRSSFNSKSKLPSKKDKLKSRPILKNYRNRRKKPSELPSKKQLRLKNLQSKRQQRLKRSLKRRQRLSKKL